MLNVLESLRWQDAFDILIVSYIIYRLILIIRGTRAVQMLTGIAILIIVYFGARELEFLTLYWLLGTFLSSIFLIIIIVFQRDIRRALTQVGQQTPFARTLEESELALDEIIDASYHLSSRKIGALIVIERETGLKDYIESGHPVDAKVSKEILISFFLPQSPLHDGGVVIKRGRIMSAGCMLPLSKNPYIQKRLGTRHRAAIGLSEETDAVVIVVSEESQQVSLVQHGAIASDLDRTSLRNRLEAIFVPKENQTQMLWKNWLNRS
jgi:diadenylate cyclase